MKKTFEEKLADWKKERAETVEKYGRLNLHLGDTVTGTIFVGSHLLTGNVYERHTGIVSVNKDDMPYIKLTPGITFMRKRPKRSVRITAFLEYKKAYANA